MDAEDTPSYQGVSRCCRGLCDVPQRGSTAWKGFMCPVRSCFVKTVSSQGRLGTLCAKVLSLSAMET